MKWDIHLDPPYEDGDQWTIMFDAREVLEIESNHEFAKWAATQGGADAFFRGGCSFDPEWSCFFAYAPRERQAEMFAWWLTRMVERRWREQNPGLVVQVVKTP